MFVWCVDFQVDPVRKQPSTHRRTMRERGKIKGEFMKKKKKTANRGLDKQTTRKEDQIKTGSIKCCPFFSVSAIVSQCVCDWHPSFFVRPVRWHVLEADTPDAYTLAVPWCLTVIWARLLDEQHSSQQRLDTEFATLYFRISFLSPFWLMTILFFVICTVVVARPWWRSIRI